MAATLRATRSGAVEGTVEPNGTAAFRGIPFAAPPTGPLRFLPPQREASWDDLRPAAEAPPACVQPDGSGSEDSLYLNVWTTNDYVERDKPVMVWVHGGGFSSGTGATDRYNGAALASKGVVVVTINYRLGVLGLLTHPCLTTEHETRAKGVVYTQGNLCLLDMVAALEWVHDSIGSFGGDAGNVTIFGESAGGAAMYYLNSSPLVAGLAHRVIVQSAGFCPTTLERSVGAAEWLLASLGVPDTASPAEQLAALQAASVEELLELQPGVVQRLTESFNTTARPCVDGVVMPLWPTAALGAGIAEQRPLMICSCRDEYRLMTSGDPKRKTLTEGELLERMGASLGAEDCAEALALYTRVRAEAGLETTPFAIWNAFQTDRLIWEPSIHYAQANEELNSRATVVLFAYESPVKHLGACHGIEIPFVFGTQASAQPMVGEGPEVDALSESMQSLWVMFASGSLDEETGYGGQHSTIIADEDALVLTSDPFGELREFWQGLRRAGKMGDEAAAAASSGGAGQSKL